LYVRVFVGGREAFPDTAGGRDWLKGQVLAIGNCQGPRSFRFFSEEEAGIEDGDGDGDDSEMKRSSKKGKERDKDLFRRPQLIRTHLAKCPSHKQHAALRQLCRLQLGMSLNPRDGKSPSHKSKSRTLSSKADEDNDDELME